MISNIIPSMDPLSVHKEFHRILRPPAWLAIVNVCGNNPGLSLMQKLGLPIEGTHNDTTACRKSISLQLSYRDRSFTKLIFHEEISVDHNSFLDLSNLTSDLIINTPSRPGGIHTEAQKRLDNPDYGEPKSIEVIAEVYLGQFAL